MLDLALIRAEAARVKAVLARRGVDPAAVDAVAELDARWTARRDVREALRLRRRRIRDEFTRRMADRPAGPAAAADGFRAPDLERAGREVAEELRAVEAEMARLAARRHAALLALPNLVMTDVPDAAPPAAPAAPPPWTKPFPPLPHWDLLDMLDLARPATATAGRGFLVWRGQGARLVRAMLGFMLDVHTRERGCEEVIAPTLATRAALMGSAHLPGLEGRMYAVGRPPPEGPSPTADPAAAGFPGPRAGDLFLAPRAEPHLAGLYAGLVLDGDHLPERLVAAAAALRQEIGSHGRAARGLLRLHEFPTVEVYTFCRPDQADAELAHAAASAETILDRLGLAHRRSLRSAPALSHAAARTVDLDVWAPGMGRWLPVAALSHFTDYQARRTGTRCSEPGGRACLAHTVGGAAVALPHALAALLETGQEADGSVRLPAALERYAGMDRLGGC